MYVCVLTYICTGFAQHLDCLDKLTKEMQRLVVEHSGLLSASMAKAARHMVYTYICMYISINIYMFVYIYTYICVCVYIYI